MSDYWEKLESSSSENSFSNSKYLLQKEDFIVKPSTIHKKGVFALKKIPSNLIFYSIPVNGVIKSNPKNNRFARLANNFYVNDPFVLNFVNHSCEPNSRIVIASKGFFLESLKMINVGEEITVDYTLTEEMGELTQCNCKSEKCRRFFYMTK